jgi:hypothetical protein
MSSQPCGQGPAFDSASSFNFSSFFLVFFSNGGYPDFYPYPYGGWKGGLSSPFPSCAMSVVVVKQHMPWDDLNGAELGAGGFGRGKHTKNHDRK